MKIDLQSIDREQFYVNEHVLNGELVYLVIPQRIGAKWTKENKVQRSSVWDSNGELISAGFPKFTNWGENPEVFPLPETLTDTTIVEKLDGSLLIVSKWKGQFILRTRGTIDAHQLDNGHELSIFEQTILPKIAALDTANTWEVSYLFEWTSPLQKIVLNYGDAPEWSLVGVVSHTGYQLLSQEALDRLAGDLRLKRPVTYKFPTIEELLSNVDQWTGKEGVCIYSNNDQSIHKCKSMWYLSLHRMKSELSSIEKVIDVWINQGYPKYNDFYNYIQSTFDYELAEYCRGNISKICDGYKEVNEIVEHMKSFVEPLKILPRKDAALKILSSYGETNRKSFAFNLLDGKELDGESIKKLIFQVLK